jgi:hypothetical protein
MTDEHKLKIGAANRGRIHSEETKNKIGIANRGVWVKYNCFNCNKECEEKQSHYKKKQRHYCSMACYSEHRKIWNMTDHNNYKGIREEGQSKQVYHRNYCSRHKDIISHLKSRRYAKEKNAIGSHTLSQWVALKNRYGDKCAFCKSESKLTKDHIIPLSKNGTDYIDNIQPLCQSCNSKKSNKINYIFENPELLK